MIQEQYYEEEYYEEEYYEQTDEPEAEMYNMQIKGEFKL